MESIGKSQGQYDIQGRDVENMKNIDRLYIQVVVWLFFWVFFLPRRADTTVTLAWGDVLVFPCQTDPV